MSKSVELTFNACKYLVFSDSYTARKQIIGDGKVFWLIDVDSDLPAMVQFCHRIGRLNNPEACLCEANKYCNDYEDFKHVVNVPNP